MGTEKLQGVKIDYTNWRGERRVRHVLPFSIVFAATEWHPVEQWLMRALDLERKDGKMLDFALANVHAWTPCVEPTSEAEDSP